MNDFFKLLDPYRWLIGGVLIASAVGAFTWYRYSLIQEGHEKAIAEVRAEALKQIERAKQQTENMQEVKDEAIENAAIRAQKNADAAAAARSELERLRKSVANNPSVSGDTCTAAVDRAAAIGAVFGECSAALAGMAENKPNVAFTVLISEQQRQRWISAGGDSNKSVIIPVPVEVPPPIRTGPLLNVEIPETLSP